MSLESELSDLTPKGLADALERLATAGTFKAIKGLGVDPDRLGAVERDLPTVATFGDVISDVAIEHDRALTAADVQMLVVGLDLAACLLHELVLIERGGEAGPT